MFNLLKQDHNLCLYNVKVVGYKNNIFIFTFNCVKHTQ